MSDHSEGTLDALEQHLRMDTNIEGKFTFFVALCFTINYIMGTGGSPDWFNVTGVAAAVVITVM